MLLKSIMGKDDVIIMFVFFTWYVVNVLQLYHQREHR